MAIPASWTPASWTVTELAGKPIGPASSPDRKDSVALHGTRPGMTWSENNSLIQQTLRPAKMRPAKMIGNTNSRLFYEYAPLAGKASTNWHIAVPGKGNICAAQIGFVEAGTAGEAKKIALSVGAAK